MIWIYSPVLLNILKRTSMRNQVSNMSLNPKSFKCLLEVDYKPCKSWFLPNKYRVSCSDARINSVIWTTTIVCDPHIILSCCSLYHLLFTFPWMHIISLCCLFPWCNQWSMCCHLWLDGMILQRSMEDRVGVRIDFSMIIVKTLRCASISNSSPEF